MKINFSDYDLTDFSVKEGEFCGIPAKLITPKDITVKFNQKNKIFRSSVWSLDGELLSASFPRFPNFGESPEEFPTPESLDGATVVDKIDGSTVIFDYVNEKLNARTRGKFSYHGLENESDFEFVIKKYPQIKYLLAAIPNISLIFEITTPNLRICIDYGSEPDIWLIGAICKDDYSLIKQESLDALAEEERFAFKRPETFKFGSLADLINQIKEKKSGEGVCLYSNSGQAIHKVKSARYLLLHRLKSQLSSFEKVMDLFFELGKPSLEEFVNYVSSHFDFEIVESVRPNIELCCKTWEKLSVDLFLLGGSVIQLKESGMDRKEMAAQILTWGELKSVGFSKLDNKNIDDKVLKGIILKRI